MGLFGKKKEEETVFCAACGNQIKGQYVKINNTKTGELLYSLCPDCNKKFQTITEKILPYPVTVEEIKDIVCNGVKSAAFAEKRVRCNVCGHVFCYTLQDVINNQKLAKQAAGAQMRGALSTLATSQILGAQQQAEADRLKAQIKDFSHCPNCNSADLKILSEDEYKAALAEKNAPAAPAAAPSAADELKKFKELLDMGVISQEEFDAKKKQLLGL